MPIKVGKVTYPRFKNLLAAVTKEHPEVRNPSGYAATIARRVEPGFDRAAAESRESRRNPFK